MIDGWVIKENRAIVRRPQVLGLPLGYAALLIMTVLFLGLVLNYIGAAFYTLGIGWGLGRLVVYYDPFAWELTTRALRVPHILRP